MANNDLISSLELNALLLDQSKLLSLAGSSLTDLLNNLFCFLDELDKNEKARSAENSSKINEFNEKFQSYMHQVEIIANSLQNSDSQLRQYRKMTDSMQNTMTQQDKKLQDLEKQKEDTRKESSVQSTYTAAMGSILGTMLWKSCKTEEMVDTFIKTGTLHEFLIMSNTTMNSFLETYSAVLPPLESYEFKFAMSIFGTIINISAQKTGRDFILSKSIGIMLIQGVLDSVNAIQMPAGQILKRMLIMLLYNISICKRGAMIIQMHNNGIGNIIKCLSNGNTMEIQGLSLTLLTSLINEIPTKELCNQVLTLTSKDDIEHLMRDGDENMKHLCSKFLNQLNELESSANAPLSQF